jgi:hypothetical protein
MTEIENWWGGEVNREFPESESQMAFKHLKKIVALTSSQIKTTIKNLFIKHRQISKCLLECHW